MYIQTEQTPNPNSLKFLLEETILDDGKNEYYVKGQNGLSSFAIDIFLIHGVEAIFLASDFITITKSDSEDWDILRPQVLQIIMEYLINKKSLILGKILMEDTKETPPEHENLTQIEKEIVEIIEDRVRPMVARDGGDISFVSFDETDGIVRVKMKGSCSGCPSSGATLQSGIKKLLQYYIPEVTDVMPVEL